MPFNWTPLRLARTAQAVRSYNSAITRKAKEYVEQGVFSDVEDAYEYLPSKTTVANVQSDVADVNDYRRIVGYKNDRKRGRPSELDRVLKSVDPKALDIDFDKGTTPYQQGQEKRQRKRLDKLVKEVEQRRQEREDMLKRSGRLQEGMSPAEKAAAYANTDVVPDYFEPDVLQDYTDDMVNKWREEDARTTTQRLDIDEYYDNFMVVWDEPMNYHMTMQGYDEVKEAMDWMHDNRPDEMWMMFNSGEDEINLEWMYINAKSSGFMSVPYEQRHSRTVRFVTNGARRAGWTG